MTKYNSYTGKMTLVQSMYDAGITAAYIHAV